MREVPLRRSLLVIEGGRDARGGETRGALVPRYNHEDIIASHGTAVLEPFSQVDQRAPIAPIIGGGAHNSSTPLTTRSCMLRTCVLGDAYWYTRRVVLHSQGHPRLELPTIANWLLTSLVTLNVLIIL